MVTTIKFDIEDTDGQHHVYECRYNPNGNDPFENEDQMMVLHQMAIDCLTFPGSHLLDDDPDTSKAKDILIASTMRMAKRADKKAYKKLKRTGLAFIVKPGFSVCVDLPGYDAMIFAQLMEDKASELAH